VHHPEKGGSANAKGDNYSSHNRQNNRNAAMANAMAAAMGQSEGFGFKMITGLSDVVEKRSNSAKKNQ